MQRRIAIILAGMLILIAAGLAYNQRNATFYLSGGTWFDACWRQREAGWDAKPASASEARLWTSCNKLADSIFFAEGMIHQRDGKTPGDDTHPDGFTSEKIATSCPDNYVDVHMGGLYSNAIDITLENGGPSLMQRFLPARALIRDAYRSRWPNCSADRKAAGIPKIILRGDKFVYSE